MIMGDKKHATDDALYVYVLEGSLVNLTVRG